MARSYRDLLAWQKAVEMAKLVYKITGEHQFPAEERYGLISQLRRAAVSVSSNIAEGQARKSAKEFIYFLYVARGSLAELDTQCLIARDLGYITQEHHKGVLAKIDELQRMTFTLIRSLQES